MATSTSWRRRTILIFVNLLFFNCLYAQITISGFVKDSKQKNVAGVSITLVDTYDGATSAADGSFKFSTTEKGKFILEFTVSGYNSVREEVIIEDKDIVINAILKEKITDLNVVTITAGSFEASDKKKGTVLSSLDIVTTASANADISAALKTLPGTQQIGEAEGLFVRGGTANESKIFIDGQLVNNFFNSSVPGIASRGRFNPFLFKGTIFSAGGYSALYGQALSSALNLESIDLPEKTEASLGVSVLSLSAGIQKLAKNKKASWGFSYDYTDLSLAFAVVKQNQDFFKTPRTHTLDANFRIKTKKGIIKYYGYLSTNSIGVRRADIDSVQLRNSFDIRNLNTFQNITWKNNIGSGWNYLAGLSFSTNKDDIKNDLINDADQQVTTPIAYAFKNFALENRATYAQARIVFEKRLKGLNKLRVGTEQFYSNEDITFTLYDGSRFPTNVKENLTAFFAETDFYLSKNLAAKIGARSEHSGFLDEWNIAPRVSVAYKFKDNSQASIASGVFYQSPERRYLPTSISDIAYAKATHYIAQYQKFKNDRIFRTEVYYKDYNNLYTIGNNSLGNNELLNNQGTGYAKGIEFFWRDKKTVKGLDYWISYSYIDTKRQFLNFPMSMTPNFAATHTASLVLKKFILPLKTGFNASYSVASGRPYYNLQYDAAQNKTIIKDNGKTIPFNNLSFSVNYLPNLGKTDKKAFAVWVLSLNNILGFKQVYGYDYGNINNTKREITPPSRSFVFLGCFLSFGVDRTQDAINNNL